MCLREEYRCTTPSNQACALCDGQWRATLRSFPPCSNLPCALLPEDFISLVRLGEMSYKLIWM